jgi:hypothetical protein
MELGFATFLVSAGAEAGISDAVSMQEQKVAAVSGITQLKKRFDPDQARAVWKAAELRRTARQKLGEMADLLVLDQEGYEMSSSLATSQFHAEILVNVGIRQTLDLCAGVGVDSIAFAKQGIAVTAYEMDAGRAMLLEENIRRSHLENLVKVVNHDVTAVSLPSADAAFFDPARRSGARRWAKDTEQTSPPLSFIKTLCSSVVDGVLVKLSPAVDRSIGHDFGADLQIVSVKGECKEALLFVGQFAVGMPASAILLPGLHKFSGGGTGRVLAAHGAYIWEPDAAIVRAGLTSSLAESLGGWLCDPHIDYFFTDRPDESPFAACYRIIQDLPYSRRALQEALEGVGTLILKQRGFPQSIEDVRGKLKLKGSKAALVILTAFDGEGFAFIVDPVAGRRRL